MSPDPTLTEGEAPGRSVGAPGARSARRAARAASSSARDATAVTDSVPAVELSVDSPTDSAGDAPDDNGAAAVGAPAGAPVALVTAEDTQSRRNRKQARRLRARKVKRIVRRFDAWSVLKVSFVFYLCVYAVSLVSSVILWNVAARAEVIDKVESFIQDMGAFTTFEFVPDELLRGVALGGAVLAVLATGLTALGAVLFNLISDLVGGVRMTVIEEPGARPALRPRKAAKIAARTSPSSS